MQKAVREKERGLKKARDPNSVPFIITTSQPTNPLIKNANLKHRNQTPPASLAMVSKSPNNDAQCRNAPPVTTTPKSRNQIPPERKKRREEEKRIKKKKKLKASAQT
jgi:hypothetical protein